MVKRILALFQLLSVVYEQLLGPLYSWIFKRFGIIRLSTTYSGATPDTRADRIVYTAELLKSAVEVKMAFGELDSGLMENETLLSAVRYAVQKNSAHIEIIHGPYIDPNTKTILTLAREGIVTLYSTNEYTPHHFMIIKSIDGTKTIIDETIHNETIWCESGKVYHKSAFRISYIRRNSVRLLNWMENEYARRKARSHVTRIDKGLGVSRANIDLPSKRDILVQGIRYAPAVFFTQPLAVLLDFPFAFFYKENNETDILNIEHMKDERDVSLNERKVSEKTENLNELENQSWIGRIASVLGTKPTYSLNLDDDPDTYDQIAVFHIYRHDANRFEELSDRTAVTLSVMRDLQPQSNFRIDIRIDNRGLDQVFYYPNVRIELDALSRRLDFFLLPEAEFGKQPKFSLFASGKIVPEIVALQPYQ